MPTQCSDEETEAMGIHEKGTGQFHPQQEGVATGADPVTW